MLSVKEFIHQSKDFTNEEKKEINDNLSEQDLGKLATVIMILISWSIIAFFIESMLIGGGVVFSIIKGINWEYFIPEFIFVLSNFIAKIYFIRWYMKDNISLSNTLYASIPTIGPGILLGIVVKNNPLFIKALRNYIRYRKQSFFKIFKK